MSIPFEMVGKLTIGKETERFNPYAETKYDSGWQKRSLKFNAICGDNRHMLTVEGGCFQDGHGDVYLFSKGYVDDSGKRIKGESFTIPFKDRFTSPRLEEVAEFKKFVIDLEKPNRRYLLKGLADRIHEGNSVTDEELKAVGLQAESEVAEALEKSKNRRREFVTEWDYAEFIKKLIDSGKYKDKKFRIKGNLEYTYSDKNERFYSKFIPTRIYLVDDDEEEISTATYELLYNKDSLDDGSVEEKGKYYINGYVFEYDRQRKSNIPCPVTVVLPVANEDADEKAKRATKLYVKQFTVEDDSWKQLGVIVNLLNGAQKVEIDESMLTEFQQDMILLGELTLDDIRKELGGSVYGDRVQENQFVKLARGYSKGRQDTVYQDEDFVIKPLDTKLPDDIEDLFDDDDDLL